VSQERSRAEGALLNADCLVLELGRRGAMGFCGSLLADLGADVVLGEPREADGDKWRNRPAVAAGKRSVDRAALDPAGELHELIDAADVLLLSSDLDADERALWSRVRPRGQIVCDVTAFGHTGPLAGRGLPEPLVDALVGAVDTTGQPVGAPVLTGAPFVEMETAVYAAGAVLAALRARRSSGQGQRIDIAIYDVGVNAMAIFIPLALTGRNASRKGNRHPASSPWNSYAARDGAVLICAWTDDLWARLCDVMGTPDLTRDPRFATPTARLENADAIDEAIGAWVGGLTVAGCMGELERHVIPGGPIVSLEDLPDEPNIAHRGALHTLDDRESGRVVRVMPSPVRVAGESCRPPRLPAIDADRAAVRERVRGRVTAGAPLRVVSGDPPSRLRPLEGVRVVEIGMNTVGPLAGKQLGALGADVIKIEPPTGDVNRTSPPLRDGGGSYHFAVANTDKRGVVLDLKTEAGAAALWRLLATADVLIENLKPGSLARLGFGADAVRGRHPELVYCSVNGVGFDSAYPGRPAFDTVVQAMSGALSATVVDGVALKSGLSLADQLGGQFGVLAVLAALDRRDRTGSGATLDLAMQECAAWATQAVWNGGSRTPASVVPVRDGHVVVVGDAALCDAVAGMTRADAAAAHPDAVAPVLGVDEMLAQPQTIERGLVVWRPSIDGDPWPVLESPLRLASTPARVAVVMGRLDHVDAALAAELELDAAHAPTATVALAP
jgi:crotonobetainyl-CoA:carnitine CoA-transferase CaiB-like acyl-CoA transferase